MSGRKRDGVKAGQAAVGLKILRDTTNGGRNFTYKHLVAVGAAGLAVAAALVGLYNSQS